MRSQSQKRRAAAQRRKKEQARSKLGLPVLGGSTFIDEMGRATTKIMPMDNVYSYLMFVGPIEAKKNPTRVSWNAALAHFLVLLNVLAQAFLLYVIYDQVVVGGNLAWMNNIMNLGLRTDGNAGLMDIVSQPASTCNSGKSLCMYNNDTFTCAPPSVQLTGRWDELDVNGDGIWTRDEVLQKRDELECKYAVNPVEVFDVFVQFLKKRESVMWLHPDVRAGNSIPKAYFTFAAGDIIMCGYRNQDMCPNLLKRGIFDGPLADGTSPRVGTTISSALDYCIGLLEPGGICDRTLPSAYTVWKIESVSQCMAPSFKKFTYKHPTTRAEKSLLQVDYAARANYEKGRTSLLFHVYKHIVVGMFVLAMAFEFKDVMLMLAWCWRFPDAAEFGEDAVKEEADPQGGPSRFAINGVTRRHRMTIFAIQVVRLVVISILTLVGLAFLLKQTDYVQLLLDAVGLVFVMEIANCLYAQVIQTELRDQCENTEPMRIATFGFEFLNERPALKDIVGFVCLVAVLVTVLQLHFVYVVRPLSDALECTCLTQGSSCREADRFNPAFWKQYWSVEVPNSFAEVARLKNGEPISALKVQKEPSVPVEKAVKTLLSGYQRHHKRRVDNASPRHRHRGLARMLNVGDA